MRTLLRNKKPFYYCNFLRKEAIVDEYGNETSEYRVVYGAAIKAYANISAATGYAQTEQFGNLDSYDKVIVTGDLKCPIDENTVLFIDKAPEWDSDGNPKYDYIVRRVAKSLNSIAIAIRKVTVS